VKINTQYIYEDTHQYVEYVKYYAEMRGQKYPGQMDDEMTTFQRQFYQYYQYAVQFVDIPDEFKACFFVFCLVLYEK